MDKIMYYCKDCDKLYKVGGPGKKVKCNSCGLELIDLGVSDDEYAAMDASEKNSLKYNARVNDVSEDTGKDESPFTNSMFLDDEPEVDSDNDSNDTELSSEDTGSNDSFFNKTVPAASSGTGKSSFFDMMPDSPNENSAYSPIYAFDNTMNSEEGRKKVQDLLGEDDDPDEKKVNFFAIPVFSFIPFKYVRLVREKGGKIFAALLIWFVILNIITGIFGAAAVNEIADTLRSELPDFEISNGSMKIDTPVYIDEDNTYVMIDESISGITAADVDAINKQGYYKTVIIAGSDSVGLFSDGRTQVLRYADIKDFAISREILCDKWIPMLKPFIFIFMILGAFFSIGFYYLAALIIQFPAGAIGKSISGSTFGNVERFRITVLAKFPVFVLVYILNKVGLSVNLLVNVIMQMIFVVLVMYFYGKMTEG